MTWLAVVVGLVVGLACGGILMTWWSSRRIEREGRRQYEMGIAEGIQIAERDRNAKGGRRAGSRQRRRKGLQQAARADDVVA